MGAEGSDLVGHIPGTEVIFKDGASKLMQCCPEPSSPPPLPHSRVVEEDLVMGFWVMLSCDG